MFNGPSVFAALCPVICLARRHQYSKSSFKGLGRAGHWSALPQKIQLDSHVCVAEALPGHFHIYSLAQSLLACVDEQCSRKNRKGRQRGGLASHQIGSIRQPKSPWTSASSLQVRQRFLTCLTKSLGELSDTSKQMYLVGNKSLVSLRYNFIVSNYGGVRYM